MSIKKYKSNEKISLDLLLGGYVKYIPHFINDNNIIINELADHLLKDIGWVQQTYNMFGKKVLTPRLLSSMMDPEFKIKMTGTVWNENTEWVKVGKNWTPLMLILKKNIENEIGKKIVYAQLNHYRTGNDYIGYHTDSEISENDIVASISLGVERRFIFRDRKQKTGEPQYEFWLGNGSLLIFNCDAGKKYWKHSLPKVRKVDNYNDIDGYGRINITFRT